MSESLDGLHFDLASFLGVAIGVLSLETFSSSLESNISIKQLLVGEVPLDSMLLLELPFVLVHQSHEVNSEISSEIDFTSHKVRNGTQVHQN